MRMRIVAMLGLGLTVLAGSGRAQEASTADARARWLNQHTLTGTDALVGLANPGWLVDCTLAVSPKVSQQRTRNYALAKVRAVTPEPTAPDRIVLTFDADAALGRVVIQTRRDDRARVLDAIVEHVRLCGADLTS